MTRSPEDPTDALVRRAWEEEWPRPGRKGLGRRPLVEALTVLPDAASQGTLAFTGGTVETLSVAWPGGCLRFSDVVAFDVAADDAPALRAPLVASRVHEGTLACVTISAWSDEASATRAQTPGLSAPVVTHYVLRLGAALLSVLAADWVLETDG